ncbi:hypothetical protein LOC67_23335 [Stieleria sp. JC731]|uniref:hypothetical protein n=1 Tax=Pirellulaceae TaxID=2691357 RepID=UPI001E658005|nr:hypothetical protein [Stieleria sp. JC731]MCC9603493.1 hypothetical protein [Stieleria sp. JC731]
MTKPPKLNPGADLHLTDGYTIQQHGHGTWCWGPEDNFGDVASIEGEGFETSTEAEKHMFDTLRFKRSACDAANETHRQAEAFRRSQRGR